MTERDGSVHDRIIEAIHTEKLGEVAEQLSASSSALTAEEAQLVESGLRACSRIRKQIIDEATSLVSQLDGRSLPCLFDADDPQLRAPQYHRFALSLEADNPTRAVELLEENGYRQPRSTKSLYWESFRRKHSEMPLIRIDDASTRLDLSWPDRPPTASWRLAAELLLQHPHKFVQAVLRRVSKQAQQSTGFESQTEFYGEFLSTPRSLLSLLVEFAELTSDDVIIDVGCGDGRVLVEAVRKTGCRGIGIDNQIDLCETAKKVITTEGLQDRITIYHGEAETAPLDEATVVFLFIPVRALCAYLPKLLSRLKVGTRVVAHEQVALEGAPASDHSSPLISDDALSVAHLWRVR